MPRQLWFSLEDLWQVRQVTARWAVEAGLPVRRAMDLVIAVHEIAANAVVHGSVRARLTVRITPGKDIAAAITDEGRWRPSAAGADGQRCGGFEGMGLPLARQVCDAVVVQAGNGGTTVTLQMRLPSSQVPGT